MRLESWKKDAHLKSDLGGSGGESACTQKGRGCARRLEGYLPSRSSPASLLLQGAYLYLPFDSKRAGPSNRASIKLQDK